MKRESGLATLAFALLALFSLTTLTAVAAPPARPTFARLKAVSLFEIDLTWRDHSGNEDGFQIERSTNHTDFRQIAQVLPGTTVYRDKNLFPGTQYFYRIRAFNSSGKSRYNTGSARTQTPVVPLSVAEWGSSYGFVPPTNTDLVSVSAGAFHTIALKKDGTVILWGLGGATLSVPTNLSNVIAISAGDGFSLALRSDGTVVEWENGGINLGGRFGFPRSPEPPILPLPGTNTFPPPIILPVQPLPPIVPVQPVGPISPPPVIQPIQLNPQPQSSPRLALTSVFAPPEGLTNVVAISAGVRHALALKSDGTVVAWGIDDLGDTEVPPDLNGVVEIAAGHAHSLALKSDGTVVGWGDGDSGAGTPPTNLTSVVAIAAGDQLSAAVKSDGTIVAWGTHGFQVTAATGDITNATAVILGEYMGTALERDGSISNWLITGTSFVVPDLGASVVQVSADFNHFAALSTAPTAPSKLSATVLSATQLRLKWQDNSTDEQYFAIERAIISNNVALPWTQIGTVAANRTRFIDTTIETNFEYSYRVRAIGKFGMSPYCTAITTVVAPIIAPSPLSATLNVTNQVTLAWRGGPYGIVGYKIEHALDDNGAPGAWQEIGSVNVTNFSFSTFSDTDVQANSTYWYRVRGFNILGFSPYNDPLSVSVAPPLAPEGLASATYGNNITIFWFANNNSLQPTGYKVETAPDINNAPGAWTEVTNIPVSYGFYRDIGRTVGVTEWYRVRAYNWVGDSPYTDPLQVTLPPTPTPYGLFASLGLTPGINLHWDSSQVDGFDVERAPDVNGSPGTWTQIGVVENLLAFQGSFTDTNVVANTTYWYRVRGFSAVGNSDYSTPLQITAAVPDAPSNLFLSLTERVQIDWTYNPSTSLAYFIERAADANSVPGAWQEIGAFTNTEPFPRFSFTDTNALPSTIYWYRVRSLNWVGYSDYSQPASIGTFPPATPPDFAAYPNRDTAQLSWNEFLGDFASFEIERAPDVGGTPGAWTLLATNAGTSESYIDTNLTANATYWYRVSASNWAGSSPYTDPIQLTILPPPVPYNLITRMGAPNSVRLVWIWLEGEDETSIERAPDIGGSPGPWDQIAMVNRPNSVPASFNDTNVVANTTYWYRLRAFSAGAFSDYTDPVSFSTVPPASPRTIFASLDHRVSVSWIYYNNGDQLGFEVDRALDANGQPGTWIQIGSLDYSNYDQIVGFTDTSVTANTTNWYRVRAFNWAGFADYSDAVSVATLPPPTPSNFSVKPYRDTVQAGWFENPANSMEFEIQRAFDAGGSPGTWINIATNTDPYNFSYTDPGLAAGAIYWYRVRAVTWVGASSFTTPLSVSLVPPGRPTEVFSTIGVATNSAILHWTHPSLDADGFRIESAPDTNGSPGKWTEIGVVPSTNELFGAFTDTNVAAFATNWYRVRAFNDLGTSDYSAPTNMALLPPAAPPNFSGAASGTNEIGLSWWDSDDGIQGYQLERASDMAGNPGAWMEIYSTSSRYDQSYPDTGLAPGTTYWYRLRTSNWIGDSPYADPIHVSTPAISGGQGAATISPQAQILSLTQTNGGMFIEWATTAGNTDVVQASESFPSSYTNISPAMVIGGIGTVSTNYFDAGALSNSPARFYRIQSSR